MDMDWIRDRILRSEYLITLHADQERRNDNLEIADMEQAILDGTVIEEYPGDPRGPSFLICGQGAGQTVHVVCGRNRSNWLVIITVYVPRPPKWVSPTQRRRK